MISKRVRGGSVALGVALVLAGCAKEVPVDNTPPKGATRMQSSSPSVGTSPAAQAIVPQKPAGAPP